MSPAAPILLRRPGPALFAAAVMLMLAAVPRAAELPERGELEWILESGGEDLGGIVFDVREYDPEGLSWILPRLKAYLDMVQQARPGLPVALVAHGEEIVSLTRSAARRHPELHEALERLVDRGLTVHVCGSFARELGLDESDFPDYVDVVPYGPAQLRDYLSLGYAHLGLEAAW